MRCSLRRLCVVALTLLPLSAWAGTAVPFTINLSKPVNVVTSGGTPRIAVDVAGTTRYANYTSGSGTSALVFTYNMQAGDVDLDGVAVSSPVQLNGGTIKDLSGNPLTNLTFTPPNTAGIKVNYPSLGMDFTNGAGGRYTLNGTAYTTLASFLSAAGGSFTRASVGTYFDSAGVLQTASANTPRLDYDPVTHAAKGILIEEARTNLLTRSSEFDDVAWIKTAGTTVSTNATTAPDGTVTADKYVLNNGSTSNDVYRPVPSATNGTTYTLTVFVKAAGYNYARIQFAGAGYSPSGLTRFNLSSGTVQSGTGTITSVGNGWYRCTVTGTGVTVATDPYIYIKSTDSVGASPTGDGTSGIYLWGAQVEVGAFPTSYIPTTTAAVTRAADVLTVPTTGGWYNQTAGAFFNDVSWQSATGTGFATFFRFDDTTTNNRWGILYAQAAAILQVDAFNSGVAQGAFTTAAATSGNTKVAAGQALNDANAAYNGVLKTKDTSWTPPTMTQLTVGGSSAVKWHKKIKYYPARVPDTQLQRMTQ